MSIVMINIPLSTNIITCGIFVCYMKKGFSKMHKALSSKRNTCFINKPSLWRNIIIQKNVNMMIENHNCRHALLSFALRSFKISCNLEWEFNGLNIVAYFAFFKPQNTKKISKYIRDRDKDVLKTLKLNIKALNALKFRYNFYTFFILNSKAIKRV